MTIHVKATNPMFPLLASVKRPGRYTGGEWGAYAVEDPDAGYALTRICLAFPDVYEVGMSYLGYQILYSLIKTLGFADAERAYCPWPDMEGEMRRAGVSLGALESGRPLSEFDAVGFSLQYELCATNIITMLDLGGIPILSADRGDGDPIVIGGGNGAYAPAPFEIFFDAFCVGDGEDVVPRILTVLRETKGRGRVERLDSLARLENVYVPGAAGGASVAVVSDLDNAFIHRTMVVPNIGIIHDRAAVQVFRGCTRGCRFCQAGMVGRPRRERGAESVAVQLEDLLSYTGWDEAGLLSLATCDWTGLGEFMPGVRGLLEKNNVRLSFPSLRMDSFSVELASGLETMRHGGITFAPEAGSERLRRVINKGLSDEDVESALGAAFKCGWEKVKLYFMMGLPTETEDDLNGIVDIADRTVRLGRANGKKGGVTVSVAGFVPKPHTPFQWEAQLPREELRERGRYMKGRIRNKKISLSYHEPDQTFLEGVFARGDSSLGKAILEAWRRGARFDGWTECFDMARWEGVFRDLEIDMEYFACRKRDTDEALPWDAIDIHVTKEFLKSERRRAFDEVFTPDCADGICNACGWHKSFSECGRFAASEWKG